MIFLRRANATKKVKKLNGRYTRASRKRWLQLKRFDLRIKIGSVYTSKKKEMTTLLLEKCQFLWIIAIKSLVKI